MDAYDHYRRACKLADQSDAEYERSIAEAAHGPTQAGSLRRAEVLAQMAYSRFLGAWVAYMGADINAAAQLVEDAKQAASEGVTPITPFLRPGGA